MDETSPTPANRTVGNECGRPTTARPAGASYNFQGSRVLVTGGSRGIGRGIALAFARSGADVTCAQRTPGDLGGHDIHNGGSISTKEVDLTSRESVGQLASDVNDEGPIDILVNNAGMQAWHDSADFPLDEFDRILEVNLRAVFHLTQAIGSRMVERRAGKIITIASLTSFIGGYRAPAYVASKGAVAQLTKALCNEWAPLGVNVNAIAPGYIETELNTALKEDDVRSTEIMRRIPADRWGEPDEIADAALFLASDSARYIHGIVLPVDGGWLAR
ncbi:SDR family oxidoreductase [Ruania alba]|uniref:2-deoxy-D-gluconate 3-dehydrogenase n=1 Tax=Ruania alba TaxID=648782 RepID=A0A1H5MAL3_9MICO|nr:SDR family oxidoreductase [Ruania alba]SEE85468.1 2-deoxy-D-gluconate 3-dehydrogenase [Ruania alba]